MDLPRSPAGLRWSHEEPSSLNLAHCRYPHGIHIDGLELTPLASPVPQKNDDFFETWDKEKEKTKSTPISRNATPPPSIGSRPSSTKPIVPSSLNPNNATTSSPPKTNGTSSTTSAPAPTTSRAVSSSSLGPTAATRTKPGQKVSRLGAKKATTSINFEEAQRKAVEEEERIKRLGYDKAREEEEARAAKEREAEEKRKAGEVRSSSAASSASKAAYVEEKVVAPKLGFGQVVGQAVAEKPKA